MIRPISRLLGAILSLILVADAARASTHEFYKGKTIRIIVGYVAGGGFDLYSRTIARHMGKHVPGKPNIVVENMPGAGSLISANHLYKVVKPDGLVMGNFSGSLFLGQALGQKGIEFDSAQFEHVGVVAKIEPACAFARSSGITSIENWMAAKVPPKMGATAPGTMGHDTSRILQAALGLPMQLVVGYKGTADIRLAVDGGELAGLCTGWESFKSTWRKQIESGDMVVVLQTLPKAHVDLPNVPLAIDFAKTDMARQLIQVGVHDIGAINRPYVLPPRTPRERVQSLRKAFMDTMKDPEFVADAEKSKLDLSPLGGEEMEGIITRLFQPSPSLLAKLKEIITPK